MTGDPKQMDVKNCDIKVIGEKVDRLRNTSGRKMTKFKSPLITKKHSIQGEWAPNQKLGVFKLENL